MNRLFEDVQTSPLKLAGVQAVAGRDRTGEQRCGMFCDARVLKVTDWVMWGIFAYWPSWSVSVNNELKPLYIYNPKLFHRHRVIGSVCKYWRCTGRHRFSNFEHTSTVPLPNIGIVSHSHTIPIICVCTHHGSQCECSLPLLIFSKFSVREDCAGGCEIFTKRWH